jgi:hypothetical protein
MEMWLYASVCRGCGVRGVVSYGSCVHSRDAVVVGGGIRCAKPRQRHQPQLVPEVAYRNYPIRPLAFRRHDPPGSHVSPWSKHRPGAGYFATLTSSHLLIPCCYSSLASIKGGNQKECYCHKVSAVKLRQSAIIPSQPFIQATDRAKIATFIVNLHPSQYYRPSHRAIPISRPHGQLNHPFKPLACTGTQDTGQKDFDSSSKAWGSSASAARG